MCNKIGTYYINQNKLEKALNEFKEVSMLYRELNMKLDYGKANRMLTEVYILQAKFTEALKYENIYMKAAKEANDFVELQRAYATLGRIHLLKGQERESVTGKCEAPTDEIYNDIKAAEKAFLKSLIITKE